MKHGHKVLTLEKAKKAVGGAAIDTKINVISQFMGVFFKKCWNLLKKVLGWFLTGVVIILVVLTALGQVWQAHDVGGVYLFFGTMVVTLVAIYVIAKFVLK